MNEHRTLLQQPEPVEERRREDQAVPPHRRHRPNRVDSTGCQMGCRHPTCSSTSASATLPAIIASIIDQVPVLGGLAMRFWQRWWPENRLWRPQLRRSVADEHHGPGGGLQEVRIRG